MRQSSTSGARRSSRVDIARHGLLVPPLPPTEVDRPRLTSILDLAARRQRLTLIIAPPGYGKTVLMSRLAADHAGENLRWLALGPEHNTVDGLTSALCDVLDSGVGLVDRMLPRVATRGERSMGTRFLAALVDELSTSPPITLVIDDLHSVTRPALLDDLAAIIEHAPRTFHVVVATQVDPPAGYYRLGLSDVLLELRRDDLAFTPDEAGALVKAITGVELTPPQVDALVAKTEGWAAGIQLAAVALRDEPDVDGFIDRFADDPRGVAEYLGEHVLGQQPSSIRRFLSSTSILRQMSGPLCDAVTGEPGSTTMLEHLDRSSMFVVRTSSTPVGYRYHSLFRTLLRAHLHADDPSLERELLERAATWHLEHQDIDGAVEYLLEASHWSAALDVAMAHGPVLLRDARTSALVRWLDRLPDHVTDGRTDVALARLAASMFGGDAAEVGDAGAELAASPLAPAERATLDLLVAYWSTIQGRPDEALTTSAAARRLYDDVEDVDLVDVLGLTGTRTDVDAALLSIDAFAHLQRGEVTRARPLFTESADRAHAFWEASILGTRALVAAWSGNLQRGEQLARRSLGLASEVGLRQPATTARLALSFVLCERGETEAAAAVLAEAEAEVEPSRHRFAPTMLAVQRAALALADGTPTVALSLLALHRPRDLVVPVRVATRRSVVEIGVHLALGDLDSAQRALDGAPDVLDAELLAAAARVAICRGDPGRAEDVLARWPDDPSPRGHQLRSLWSAVLAHHRGDTATAATLLARAVASAELQEDVGVLRSGGTQVMDVLRELYLVAPTAFLGRVLARPLVAELKPRTVDGLVEQITGREHAVLAVLSTRMSNVEIAERFGISLNTVKTHLKHIYRKLDVDSRSEAIAAAERLGLL